ncbi:hypothetical protein K0U83_13190 [bacterium]|nr:hypothetical protein [bacterium]
MGVRDANDNQDHLFVFAGEPTNSVAFDTTPDTSRALGIGELRWNDTDGTLEFVLKGGNVTLQIGQEQVTLVKPVTGNLLEGKVVYIAGSDGGNKTAAYAQANGEGPSNTTFGLMTETASGGNKGFCTTFGMVRNIDTSALTEGAIVWLSPSVAGGMTTTKPVAPNHLVQIGYCVRSHANVGSVFVSVKNGYELEELHNVKITDPQDGQVLKYQASTGLWINAAP